MKKLIILPGNSIKNKAWSEAVASHFGHLFDAVYAQEYSHWEVEGASMDFNLEVTVLQQEIAQDSKETDYYIFAKSFGSVLSLLAISKEVIHPHQCVFFGMPLNLVEEQNIFNGDWSPVVDFSIPAISFQNKEDPVASYAVVSEKWQEQREKTLRIIPMEETDHQYGNFYTYDSVIDDFLYENR